MAQKEAEMEKKAPFRALFKPLQILYVSQNGTNQFKWKPVRGWDIWKT